MILLFLSILTTVTALPGWNGPQDGGWGGNSNNSPWGSYGSQDGSNINGGTSPSVAGAQILGSISAYNRYTVILIVHALLASLVWIIFVPTAAVLLRINISNPIVLKLHAGLQIIAFAIFTVAAGLGIWLAQQVPTQTWRDIHPRLGLAILALASLQPFFGYVHHHIYKKRVAATSAGHQIKPPSRTTPGRIHLWLGRSLIILGVVNGGLGIRLASRSPLQSSSNSTKATIAYGVSAGVIAVGYATVVLVFELRRRKARIGAAAPSTIQMGKLPTYEESESSLSPPATTSQR